MAPLPPAGRSSTAKPLNDDFDSSELDTLLRFVPGVSLRDLEDGSEAFQDADLRSDIGFVPWLLMLVRRRRNGASRESAQVHDSIKLPMEDEKDVRRNLIWRRYATRAALWTPVAVLCFFGLVHLFNVFLLYVPLLLDDYSPSYPTWPQPGDVPSPGQDPPSNITQNVQPIPCHSHNDYWRQIPLYEALHYGCTGVEADVWLFDNDLYVGHSTNALTRDKTFQSMYIDPLVKMLDQQNTPSEFTTSSNDTTSGPKNGIFQLAPTQTLVLLVDFKNSGPAILPFVHSQLSPLRDRGYLSFYDGHTTHSRPITVVATGNAPFNLLTANTAYRDIFFDAPLDRLYEPPSPPHPDFNDQLPGPPLLSPRDGQGTVGTTPDSVFDASNSYYASVSFRASIGYLWRGRLSAAQLERIRGQVRGARARGLKARYWSTPAWPVGLRNHVWEVLVREGADVLNGDELVEITRVDWRGRRHGGVMG